MQLHIDSGTKGTGKTTRLLAKAKSNSHGEQALLYGCNLTTQALERQVQRLAQRGEMAIYIDACSPKQACRLLHMGASLPTDLIIHIAMDHSETIGRATWAGKGAGP